MGRPTVCGTQHVQAKLGREPLSAPRKSPRLTFCQVSEAVLPAGTRTPPNGATDAARGRMGGGFALKSYRFTRSNR